MSVSPSMEPAKKRSSASILGTLRAAVRKVRFLLSFSATRWMLLSSVVARGGGGSPPTPRRPLSFGSRPGLLDVDGSILSPSSPASSRTTSRSASMGTATTRSVSRTSSAASAASPSEPLTRTSSRGSGSPAGDADIDRRAEEFIANFYRQLQMERQVSLQLRYVRGNSWERTP